MVVINEIEGLTKKFSVANSRQTTISLTDTILAKIESHYFEVESKLKPLEISKYNFALAEIRDIVPARLDRDAATEQNHTNRKEAHLISLLVHHTRAINLIFKTVHFRVNNPG